MDAPRRRVVHMADLEGPRGGTIRAYALDCGHLVWMRRGRPRRNMACLSCYLEPELERVRREAALAMLRDRPQALCGTCCRRHLHQESWCGQVECRICGGDPMFDGTAPDECSCCRGPLDRRKSG